MGGGWSGAKSGVVRQVGATTHVPKRAGRVHDLRARLCDPLLSSLMLPGCGSALVRVSLNGKPPPHTASAHQHATARNESALYRRKAPPTAGHAHRVSHRGSPPTKTARNPKDYKARSVDEYRTCAGRKRNPNLKIGGRKPIKNGTTENTARHTQQPGQAHFQPANAEAGGGSPAPHPPAWQPCRTTPSPRSDSWRRKPRPAPAAASKQPPQPRRRHEKPGPAQRKRRRGSGEENRTRRPPRMGKHTQKRCHPPPPRKNEAQAPGDRRKGQTCQDEGDPNQTRAKNSGFAQPSTA